MKNRSKGKRWEFCLLQPSQATPPHAASPSVTLPVRALPPAIPQTKSGCWPHCSSSVFDIAVLLPHKRGQVTFLTSRSSQINYTVTRATSPPGRVGHSAGAELHEEQQNKCHHGATGLPGKSSVRGVREKMTRAI